MNPLGRFRQYRAQAVTFAAILALGFTHCMQVAGTVDEIDTGVARVFNPDGSPSVNASITVYVHQDTVVARQTATDSAGRFSLDDLTGTFSIWAQKDSLVAFQDSVHLSSRGSNLVNDTLCLPGAIAGRVGLQTGDPSAAVLVHALGTDIYANVNDSGSFVLNGLAQGEYVLRLTADLPEYAPTITRPVSVRSSITTVIPEPIDLIYIGIPSITGLVGSFDTLNGIIELRWDSTSYPHVQEYLVYRRNGQDATEPFLLRAATGQPSFTEPAVSIEDGVRATVFQYKVLIRDLFQNEGRYYGFVEVSTCPRESVLTTIAFNYRCAAVTPIDSPIIIVAAARNPTRNLHRIVWKNQRSQQIIRERTVQEPQLRVDDTLLFTPREQADLVLSATVVDGSGATHEASIPVLVRPAAIVGVCNNDTVSGIHPFVISAQQTPEIVSLSLAGLTISAQLSGGSARCTLDTRAIYPPQSRRLVLSAANGYRDTSWVVVSNPDPLIGCWASLPDSLVRECYRADGSMESDRGYTWLLGWERSGERVRIIQANSQDLVFAPVFTDYDHCTLNGIDFVRVTR